MNTILKVSAIACGLVVVGCASRMTAINSDRPNAVNGVLKGEFVLDQVKSNVADIGSDVIRAAIQKETTASSIFKGRAQDKDALPIDITVDCISREANGSIASFNNLLACCTLTVWPYVDAKEYEYAVTVSSVVGSHKVNLKVLDRDWFGLSPFAMIPVPGWSDKRGDDAEIKQFHIAQIAVVAKEACAHLPSDYAAFKKDQPQYLEKISQIRSEMAFATFLAASSARGKVEALTKVLNATIITKHQHDLISAFVSNSEGSVRNAILAKLNDGSFDALPYDSTLIPYWPKLGDSRLLAMVYRDAYAKLSEEERKNLVSKISDDAVLMEMITVPSRDTQNKKNLYVEDAEARVTLYQAMKVEAIKRFADAVLATQEVSDWDSGHISALATVADMCTAVADKNVAAEIAIALACNVDAYKHTRRGASLKKHITPKITQVLSDDIILSRIKADRKLWSALADYITDKSKVSDLAYGFITKAAKSEKENTILEAWELYGDAISDDVLLMKLSVGVLPLRRLAFMKIKDEAMKAKTLDMFKASLNAQLNDCVVKQGELGGIITEINNGEELVDWVKQSSDRTDVQNEKAFNKLKWQRIVLRGEVKNVGKSPLENNKPYIILRVKYGGVFDHADVRFNVPASLTSLVMSWAKGEIHVMRGRVSSEGGLFMEDVECENGEIVPDELYDKVVSLKKNMDDIKWQLKEIEEQNAPPLHTRPSRFGNAVKSAAGWIKDCADDVKASSDDLEQAAEMIMSVFD